jgi:hypothetical protein
MNDGYPDTVFAFYCLHHFHWTPSQYLDLEDKEKIVVRAFIEERIDAEEAARKKAERESS